MARVEERGKFEGQIIKSIREGFEHLCSLLPSKEKNFLKSKFEVQKAFYYKGIPKKKLLSYKFEDKVCNYKRFEKGFKIKSLAKGMTNKNL